MFFENDGDTEFTGREELNLSLSSQLTRYWRASMNALRDMDESDLRSLGFSATYEDECLIFSTDITRHFFEDRDLKPSNAIVFRATFKTLGEVTSGLRTGS